MQDKYELSVVIPAYNEEIHIESLIREWHHVFESNSISYQFIIIDDGSIDNTVQLVKGLKANIPAITVYSQSNKGHGPAILNGYKIGISSPWVFQIDGDHQLETDTFAELWQHRHDYDFLLAERNAKNATTARKLVSMTSKLIVYGLYNKGIKDVNSPYRLMRSSLLQAAILKIPSGSFAPNVLISAFFLFHKKRIYLSKVDNRKDINLNKSRMNKYFLKGCINSIFQIIKFRFTV
jgi:glycosyltransferase involved in cell wall biosynthesis